MKAKLRAVIDSVSKEDGFTVLHVNSFDGRVTDTTNISAQDCSFSGKLKLKKLIADKIAIGAKLLVEVSVVEEGE